MPQITIDMTVDQAQRVLNWFRAYTGNPDATAADYKAWIIQITRDKVFHYERSKTQPDSFGPT